MNADIISYRYDRSELSALGLILGLPPLPGAPLPPIDAAAYRAAVDSLADSGLVTPAGDRAIVDRLTALLLSNVAKSRFYICFDAPDRAIVLWRCPVMCVLGVFPERGACSLTPLPALSDCESALADALSRCAFPIGAGSSLLNGETLSAADAEALAAVRERLMQLAFSAETPDSDNTI